MALGVQLSSKYEIIGGPRETGARRMNMVPNPQPRYNAVTTPWVTTGFYLNAGGAISPAVPTGGPTFSGNSGYWNVAVTSAITSEGAAIDLQAPPGGIVIGRKYTAFAYIHSLSTGSGNIDMYLGEADAGALANTVITPTAAWVRYAVSFTAVSTDNLRLAIRTTTATARSWGMVVAVMDTTGFTIANGAISAATDALYPQWDGGSPGYYWTGTPYNSGSAQDGTRAVLNDDTDPDFVGYAMDVTGLEGSDVRENVVANVEADGAVHGEFYQDRRPVTITAAIGGNVTPTTRNTRLARWTAASRALRSRGTAHRPATLRWQPDGAVASVYTTLRRQQKPTVSGLQLKDASIAMVAADPRIYGQGLKSDQHTPAGAGTAGRTYDRSYDVNFNWAAQRGTFTITNVGDADTPVIIEFLNGMSTFALQNLTTEEEISINGVIVNGQSITVNTGDRTLYLQDGTNVFDRVAIERTRWWGLAPGLNTLSFLADTFDASARVRVYHRPAWA